MLKSSTIVGMLCGGISGERYLSIRAGGYIASLLSEMHCDPMYIDWSAHDTWTVYTFDKQVAAVGTSLDEVLCQIKFSCVIDLFCGKDELLFNSTDVLEHHSILHIGNSWRTSYYGSDKLHIKSLCKKNHLPYIPGIAVNSIHEAGSESIIKEVSFPCFIKPVRSGSSIDAAIVHNRNEYFYTMSQISESSFPLLIETYVKGLEFSCGVIKNLKDGSYTATPVAHIAYDSVFFDSATKQNGCYTVIPNPKNISPENVTKVQNYALALHNAIGAEYFTRTDFIIDPAGSIHVLEINTHPGLGEHSILPQLINSSGILFEQYIKALVKKVITIQKNICL